ncbi:MAG: hypothetical protein RLZZ165_954 [Bacteroidota bacterium]|jgi:tRNA U34 5-methylaminomethyl-2-thiouridine-forming methyltransferase MnmC
MNGRMRFETADGSHSIYVPTLQESYHSRHGAVQESRHVFIEMGLKRAAARQSRLRILEVGFGTGLNAMLTALEAEAMALEIEYWSLEPYPLEAFELQGLNYAAIAQDKAAEPTWEAIHAAEWEHMQSVSPHFSLHKMAATLESATLPQNMDVIYFDAFAPEKQPELWTQEVFERIHALMSSQGLLTTYCAKGSVRRTLQAVGFQVTREQGPPGKREMLVAKK